MDNLKNIAFVFSGQGSQYSGMGKSFYEESEGVKSLFNKAEKHKKGITEMCFYGSSEDLSKTENTQSLIYLCDCASALYLKENKILPSALAGFSLGELSALWFSGAYDFESGFKIVMNRGKFMSEAAKEFDSSMVAILKLPPQKVIDLCGEFKNVFAVNFNSPEQTVVSGLKNQLPEFIKLVKESGGKCIPLAVSGAFHSKFMDKAANNFEHYLKEIKIETPKISIYSNTTAKPYGNCKEYLVKQIKSPVLWTNTINNMIENKIDTFIEVGVGNILSKLIGKINSNVRVYNAENINFAKDIINELNY